MKKLFTLLALLLFYSFSFAQFFHDTQGKIEVSNNGQAIYTLPIAMPPSIKNVGPIINLVYSSGQNSGIAGQGWGINTISTINRISTRTDIDEFKDGVDFDDNDKLALDGQRLLLKSGTYWADGSIYETEVQSNQKIELKGSGSSIYFIVTSPDGSRTWYGNFGGMNATDATAYYIVRFEDMHGNFMTYNYARPLNQSLCISEINFSGNTVTNPTTLNKIVFTYKPANRKEYAFIKGSKIEKAEILDKIEVFTNNLLFKRYALTHISDNEGYQRVSQLQEFNSALEPANPVIFEYKTTPNTVLEVTSSYNDALDLSTSPDLSGDFDGDGRLDFVSGSKLYTKLFQQGGNVYTVPFNAPARQKFTATTLNGLKLNQKQSLVFADEQSDSVDFKFYSQEGTSIVHSFTKTIPLNNRGNCYDTCTDLDYDENGNVLTGPGHPTSMCSSEFFTKNSNKYIEGDFNGDGISEVVILSYSQTKIYQMVPDDGTTPILDPGIEGGGPIMICKPTNSTSENVQGIRIVDLNPNSPTNDNTFGNFSLTGQNLIVLSNGERFINDYNSDGKTDILVIDENKNYKVINFKQLTQAPWVELEVIGQGIIDDYVKNKQLIFGDFNGDGKIDLMIPNGDAQGCSGCNLWHIYYSNPQVNGGAFFTKESHTAAEYWAYTGEHYDTQWHTSNYFAMDVNKDGKSDLVRMWTKLYQPSTFWDPKNIDSQWSLEVYLNNIGLNGSFTLYYQSPSNHNSDDNSRPFSLASNFKYKGLDCELLVLRYHGNNSFYKTISYIDFKRDFNQENLLEKVTQSGGGIVDTITYDSMTSTDVNNGFGNLNEFYSSTESLNYPYVEIKLMPTNYLVKRISNTSAGIVKYQDYLYHGLGVNMNGLGVVGFKKTARSSWYLNRSDKKNWNVFHYDILKRGALLANYIKNPINSNFSFENIPTNYSSLTENTYTETLDPQTKRYALLLSKTTNTNSLTGVITEQLVNSYSTDTFLPLSETVNNYLGTTLHGRTTTTREYFPSSINGVGVNYHIGRPKEINTIKTVYVNTPNGAIDTKTSTEKFEFLNGNVSRIEKKANNDIVSIIETMNYFSNGLLKDKTLSATGTTSANSVSARTTSYTYDTTNRFVKTETDVEGKVKTYVTYHPIYGTVTEVKNFLNQSTKSTYDSWGKVTKVTDFLNKNINYSYSKSNGVYSTTELADDGASTITENDALAREIRKGILDINGNWVYTSTEYDYLGRKFKVSEPYFGNSSPDLWTVFEYDDYSRPIKTTQPTGKVITTTYSGLTVTAFDSVMSKSKTMNANGVVITATDFPGGTIQYKFDANENLLLSDYDGVITTMEYDNWGRKTKIVDSSAGTYTYKYNAFNEIREETTPKGTTTYTLNPVGKILTKSIIGDGTSITSTYTYDPTNKWLTNIAVTNPNDGNGNFAYSYDTVTKQLNRTIEIIYPVGSTTPLATFTKQVTFDGFGRVSNETNTAVSHGKTSSKTVTHVYKNGKNWQIKDGASVLWQLNSTTRRGQLASASLGNGITVTNSYDNYGYMQQIKHDLSTTNVVTLNTSFEPILGNLESRFSSLFNLSETFEYDDLDRLTKWRSDATTLLNLPFNSGVEGFTSNNGTGSFSNNLGKLRVNAYNYQSGVKRVITTNAVNGTEYIIKFEFNRSQSNGVVHAKIIESDPINGEFVEEELGAIPNGNFQANYTSQYYPKIEIVFYIAALQEGSNVGINPGDGSAVIPTSTFTIDNFNVRKNDQFEQNYDDRGRILQNELGQYQYENNAKPYQNTSLLTSANTSQYYTNRPLQNVTYNAFKAPVTISESGIDLLSFSYNAFQERSILYYGSTNTNKLLRPFRKYYSENGSIEIKTTFNAGNSTTPAAIEFITYIGGDAYSAPIVLKSNGTTQNYFYLHRDYQGSIVAVTNATGSVVEKRHYDPWGAIVAIQNGTGTNLTKLTFFERGYTGHEHLETVGLIHMNGRLYDPKLHRFLQPDNFVQDIYNTQNYNRYGYCYNNPLKYTDPSGELIDAIVIGAAVGLASYFVSTVLSGQAVTLKGALTATFVGALSGAVTCGIGEWTKTINTFALKATTQALAHGVFQGVLSGVQGGGFWTGFASGSLSSLASSMYAGVGADNAGWHGLAGCSALNTETGMVIFGSVMGGAGASLTGGNFWKGAVTGLIVSGLNHALHSGNNNYKGDDDANVYVEKDGVGHVYVEVDGTVYSYGRYNGSYSPASGSLGPLGDGVLLKLDGQTAANFISERTANYPTEKFTVKVNASRVKSYYNKLYNNGTPLQGKTGYNAYGRVIGTYNLVGPGGNNCTTLTYKALNYGGANIRPAQTPAGMLYDLREINYINQGYNPSQRLWGPK